MPFTTPLEARELGPREWQLTSDLRYEGARDVFLIPAGFVTDYASVPRLFWALVPPTGRYTRAAVLHDWLYVEAPFVKAMVDGYFGDVRPHSTLRRQVTRRDADGLFLRAMKESGVSWWRRHLMHRAVRLAGGRLWAKARARQRSAG